MPKVSFSRTISRYAEERGKITAVTCGELSKSWLQIHRSSNQMARALLKRHVARDDLVTIALPNSIEFVESCVALWKIGATPQPVSPQLPRQELERITELSGTPLIIGDNPRWSQLKQVFDPASDVVADESAAPLPDAVAKSWKAPTSGGSTGLPKIIVSNLSSEIDIHEESLLKLPTDDVVLIPGPLYHNGPFIGGLEGLIRGNHVVLMQRFDPLHTLELIEKHRVNWVFLVPTMMHRIIRLGNNTLRKFDVSSICMVVHSASKCPCWLKEVWIEWLGPDRIGEIYGGTEGQGGTYITGREWLTHKGSVGKSIPGMNFKILDEAGREVEYGELGEIYFLPDSGQGSTYRYIGAEPTATQDGWETLGDIGYCDRDGYLYLVDRKKDLIISGGANVYPAEVEAAIEAHPAVRSCVVVGVEDEDLGQKVHAVVEANSGLTEELLRDFLGEQIVRYKIPRSFEFVDFPLRNEAGKVCRQAFVSSGG